jgi:hypothetical protein
MAKARTRRTTARSYRLELPADRWAAIAAVAQARGESIAQWLRRAIRSQLYLDAAAPEADTLLSLAAQALGPTRAAAEAARDGVEGLAAVLADLLAQVLVLHGVAPDHAQALADERVAAAVGAARGEGVAGAD